MSVTRDFWLASGHHLLDRDAEGRLRITGDFVKAYLARPELVPPADACPAERELHRLLLTTRGVPSRTLRSRASRTPMRKRTGAP